MWRFSLIIVFSLAIFPLKSQTICGWIYDSENQEPIPGVHIYLGNSHKGEISDLDGKFCLKVPAQRVEMVFSHIAFQKESYALDLTGRSDSLYYKIPLTLLSSELETVEVSSKKDKKWNRQFNRFRDEFLSKTLNSEQCEILNPWILNFEKEKEIQ